MDTSKTVLTASDWLKRALNTRNRFLTWWTVTKGFDNDRLTKFLAYPFELQIGYFIEFLAHCNIGIVGYNQSYDLFIINPELLDNRDKELNKTKSHFVYQYRDNLVLICDLQNVKHPGVGNVVQGYNIAICTAINWLNSEKEK